jgi:hypothetical protein
LGFKLPAAIEKAELIAMPDASFHFFQHRKASKLCLTCLKANTRRADLGK